MKHCRVVPGSPFRCATPGLALALFATASLAAGAAGAAAVGRYGFNWSKPDTATCERVTEALAARFSECHPGDTESFTGKRDHLVCSLPDGEFLAFPDRARCVEELETMQANAP